MNMDNQQGYLELFIGPMFSGKTTHLIQCYKQYHYIGKKVCVINYKDDTRYHDSMLSTHDKMMIPCIQTHSIRGVMDKALSAEVVLINEGQFFHDLYDCVLEMVERYNIKVYISALDGDFKRKKFGGILDLIPYCDKVSKLNALCSSCKNGTKALFSHRVSSENEQIVIGVDNYIPVCRSCYQKANIPQNVAYDVFDS